MEILFYLIPLLICQVIVYGLSVFLDHYFKIKKKQIKRKCFFMVQSNHNKSKTISLVSYYFQWLNFIFVLAYLSIAITETFIYRNFLLKNIDLYSIVIYGGLSLLSVTVISLLTYLAEE